MSRSNLLVSWSGLAPSLIIDTYFASLAGPCTGAALGGLALCPFLSGLSLVCALPRQLCADFVHGLSTANSYMHHLEVRACTVAADAWVALPAALPALPACTLVVDTLSPGSIAALGALCRGAPGLPGCELRHITVLVRGYAARPPEPELGFTLRQLRQLQTELKDCGARLRLRCENAF